MIMVDYLRTYRCNPVENEKILPESPDSCLTVVRNVTSSLLRSNINASVTTLSGSARFLFGSKI